VGVKEKKGEEGEPTERELKTKEFQKGKRGRISLKKARTCQRE
jgi:hypothetical protein